MENINSEANDILNDLIEINNDRIKGYEQARDEVGEDASSMKQLFSECITQSSGFKKELEAMIQVNAGEVEADNKTTTSGALYHFWMDLKTAFTGKNVHSVLQLCEFGEDAAQKSYRQALESDATTDIDVRALIKKQKNELKSIHDKIKLLRDSNK